MEYIQQLGVQHTWYQWESPLKVSGLTSERASEVARLTALLDEMINSGQVEETELLDRVGSLRVGEWASSRQHKGLVLHCHLQLELLWALNWSLHLLGVL